jgi:hypothetical protein
MRFYMSGAGGGADVGKSYLHVEWTNQHGCGGHDDSDPHKLNCNMVLQYMCQDDDNQAARDDSITIRNGIQTNTQDFTASDNDNDNQNTVQNRRNGNVRDDRGLHESWEWYDDCNRRERNKGLFTADQNVNEEAVNTRQNPNGNRRGYECPEERDYYPYWHPTPWMDVAVLAHNESMCSMYKEKSFNSQPYGRCVEKFQNSNNPKHWSTANNPAACAEKGGEWQDFESYLELAPEYTTKAQCEAQSEGTIKYKWGKPYDPKKIVNHQNIADACMVALPEVDCKPADWSRVNHLGNGRDPLPLNYTWELPYFPSEKRKRCVFRLRYNISTDDYDPFGTFSDSNQEKTNGVVTQRSPIEQNPLVDVGFDGRQLLQLAINTAQTGRTFQDRSHAFWLVSRKDTDGGDCTGNAAACNFDPIPNDVTVYNVFVRGKRGNIVQTFPAVEYDFVPQNLEVTPDDFIAMQWAGSNTHNNGNPAGDGQAGDAGEGRGGTDRNNICEVKDASTNFCVPFEENTLFTCMKVHWSTYGLYGGDDEMRNVSIALQMMSSGYFHCLEGGCSARPGTKGNMQVTLNNAPASTHGWVFSLNCKGRTFHYISSRNNNFTNRSQKAKIKVL